MCVYIHNIYIYICIEALFVLSLRGHTTRVVARTVADQARALAMYNKIPRVLMNRMPDYAEHLKDFASILAFHKAYPIGLHVDGRLLYLYVY